MNDARDFSKQTIGIEGNMFLTLDGPVELVTYPGYVVV